jgi:xanthine dehydrogenase YagS FAD-binding subunit
MERFEYASPVTKEVAVRLLGEDSAILAGGTDLISLLKDDIVTPKRVVNIKGIRELEGVEYDAGSGLRIGALVTLDELIQNEQVGEEYPALKQAAEGVRSPQIQAVGTVGGDLCQRPRCWYFRNGFGLLAMQNGQSMVPEGDNRYHAILGNSGPAHFLNPSSLAPALIALGATLKVFGSSGEREMSVEEFYQAPRSEGDREYKLEQDEIVTEILVPPASSKRNATYEIREKEALDWPLAAAAVAMEINGDQIGSARVVLGHVAPVPWVSAEASQALSGKALSEAVAEEAGQAAVAKATALSKNKYKIQLARVAVKRAILRAAGMEV